MDFDRYKPRLFDYLKHKGITPVIGLNKCFNPAHGDKNPSCLLTQIFFHCYSPNCGITGDIYDAIEILEGIHDKDDQFRFAEQLFGEEP